MIETIAGAVVPRGVFDEDPRLELRSVDAGGRQPGATTLERSGDGLRHASPPLRASDW